MKPVEEERSPDEDAVALKASDSTDTNRDKNKKIVFPSQQKRIKTGKKRRRKNNKYIRTKRPALLI